MEKNKEVVIGQDVRIRIKSGIDKGAIYVAPSLGAIGMSAIIEFKGLDPIECDDGVTILKNLKFKDSYEQFGLQKLRKAAIRTSTEGKDGTATTTILTQALVTEAFQAIQGDSSKIREVKDRLVEGLRDTIDALTKIKRDVSLEEIEKVANTSSLDPEVSKIIADVVKKVGPSGAITVEKQAELGYSSEVVIGAKFNKGLISDYFINNPEGKNTILDNPYIALIDRKVSLGDQLKNLMEDIAKSGNKSILLIADDIAGSALASMIQASKMVTLVNPQGIAKTGTYDIACVMNPYTGSRSREFLRDIAALTGATVISEEAGMKLDNANVSLLGRATKVVVTKDSCTIQGGNANQEVLQDRINALKNEIGQTTSEYQKLMLQDRLAQLTGGIGVIRVGAYTDTEFNAKKYKFDNAISSTQLALQEGIIAGGGSALARLKVNEPMFQNILEIPLKQMAINAGMKWYEVLHDVTSQTEEGFGYDFKIKKLVNMFDKGIIDPFKTIRLALEAATSCAMSLISLEIAITDLEDKPDVE